MVSEAARILHAYHESEKRADRRRKKQHRKSDQQRQSFAGDERVLVARERIQAKSLEVALRKDRYHRAQLATDPNKASRAVVQQHKGRKLALLNERPTKGMVRVRVRACFVERS